MLCVHGGAARPSVRPPAACFTARSPVHVRYVRGYQGTAGRGVRALRAVNLKDAELVSLADPEQVEQVPEASGVYAVFDKENKLQYVGISRKIKVSVSNHAKDLPELAAGVKYTVVESGTKEDLTTWWKQWIEEHVAEHSAVPPGNLSGESAKWQSRARPARPEIRLTAGKPISGITIEQLIDQVVKSNKVVAFVKGTRTSPQCGFSHRMLTLLNDARAEYDVVNVLDEVSNPGLREAIKTYSQWPTIPQLFIGGEFVGGSDIVSEMAENGELVAALKQAKAV